MVITGSPRSLVEGSSRGWTTPPRSCAPPTDAGVPVLGVCFGHQLVGYAYGGRVRKNPNGWEVGTVDVELTDEGARDPLFAGLPRRIFVNQSHRDEVGTLGPDTRVLAAGAHTPHQAIAVGDARARRAVSSRDERAGHPAHHRAPPPPSSPTTPAVAAAPATASTRSSPAPSDTPDAERVLVNFVDQFVQRTLARQPEPDVEAELGVEAELAIHVLRRIVGARDEVDEIGARAPARARRVSMTSVRPTPRRRASGSVPTEKMLATPRWMASPTVPTTRRSRSATKTSSAPRSLLARIEPTISIDTDGAYHASSRFMRSMAKANASHGASSGTRFKTHARRARA